MSIDDVELGRTVQVLLESRGRDLGTQVSASINMVPSVFRELSPNSYNPKTVSIGPLHKHDENLVEFEAQKLSYLHDLLDHVESSPAEQTLKECLEKVSCSLDRIRACYKNLEAYKDVDLATMMVIDGCFILNFIFSLSKFDARLRKNMLITQSIIYDLVLIENQIPFFVLQDLFESTILKFVPNSSLTKHIKVLLRHYNLFEANLVLRGTGTPDHILGLLHKSYQPADDIPSRLNRIPKALSAVQLDRAGVNFKPNEDRNWALQMKIQLRNKFTCFPTWFGRKPTLRMPVVCIDDFTDLVLKNLIVYEHFSEVRNYVTSYVCAMDMLISTPDDVALLVESHVLVNDLGSNEEAANMIKSICKYLPIVDFFYLAPWEQLEKYSSAYESNKTRHLIEQLDDYYAGSRTNTTAKLKRGTFSNPWIPFALFAVIILFALTLIQTIYTIKPPPS